MEYKDKIKIAITITSFAALTILFTAQYRRRSRSKQKSPPTSCYLHSNPKPQLAFKRVLADNSFSQFKHLKLNHSVTEKENCSNLHPYEQEITALIDNPRVEFEFEFDLTTKTSDGYVWVDTESQLKELADTLSKERVFAVDTEQHSLRSFLGFTALVQISTQKEDYLLDAIALHDVIGILRPVFADPSICKVFHGADNDVIWLQRDFHIYVVNLFDSAKACEVLSKPQKSLAYLLETYCGVATNKLLQREDWRQRPLSAEMLQYALVDARYLLYIASCLTAELKQRDCDNPSCSEDNVHFFLEACRRSNMSCLQLYSKEIEVSPGQSAASSIFSRLLNGHRGSSISCETQDLVRRLCTWRDLMSRPEQTRLVPGMVASWITSRVPRPLQPYMVAFFLFEARVHDESLRYVFSDQAILSLAEKVTTTPEIYDTLAQADLVSDPMNFNSSLQSPSPVVCSHLDDLYYLTQDKKSNLDDVFLVLLQRCLGPSGSCPLSVYNYALLVNCDLRLTNRLVSKQNRVKKSKQVCRKASRDLFVQKFSCKSPVYHNCRIYANDGRLLCYCDRRKLEWYLRRDLAKLVDDNPPAIMLLFEPKGRPEDEDNDFYIQSKKNICVGCGEGGHYLRYRIIPSCYRMHFPEHLKSHRSHDIVLLCVDCHEIAHAAAEKYKRQVAAEFGIPLFVLKVVDSKEAPVISGPSSLVVNVDEAGVSPLQLRTAAMALLRHGQKMPPKRHEELTQIVMQYYGGREISKEDLERALLVGMSPHERKRLEKKRGLSLKNSIGSVLTDKEQMIDIVSKAILTDKEQMIDIVSKAISSIENVSKSDTLGASETAVEPTGVKEDQKYFTITYTDMSGPISDLRVGVVSSTAEKTMNPDESKASDVKDVCVGNAHDNCENSLNGTLDLYSQRDDGSPLKSNSKLSLLGHGPHGKQVVDHILKEHGGDSIREFCQRWRQVFVEAIHPRFLPAGWDVMHSGRRDFGEFSVYNPAKKASAEK